MFNETENQTDESQIEKLNQNENKSGKRKKVYSIIGIILILIFAGGAVMGGYYFWDDIASILNLEKQEDIDCAMDTKECPDGSFVSRVSPSCEFAECAVIDEEKDCVKEGVEYLIEPIPTGSPRNLCCAELSGKLSYTIINNKCNINKINKDIAVCINCPNGECGLGENKCNCPQDCGETFDASDWQTYRDEKYGFEIKHPIDWSWEEINKEAIQNIHIKSLDLPVLKQYSIGSEEERIGVAVYILDNSVNKSIDDCDWIDEDESEINDHLSELEIIIPKTNFQVNNLKVIKEGVHSKLFNMSNIDVAINLSPEKIVILQFLASGYSEKQFDTFNQIISTFKLFQDIDNDGLSDDDEAQYGCDINNPDTDGDGYLDGDEIENGYNPIGEGKL